jgi:phosphohistidine phosphatase
MKTLILVRHAKSSWDDITQKDIERPLNERGKKDAPEMAKRLKERDIKIDLFVTSPAKRAKKTAKLFAEEFKSEDVQMADDLYDPSMEDFTKTVKLLPDDKNTIAIFSHNPGITQFANSLSNVKVDDLPTCAAFAVSSEGDSWKTFLDDEKKFLFFDYPKNPIG